MRAFRRDGRLLGRLDSGFALLLRILKSTLLPLEHDLGVMLAVVVDVFMADVGLLVHVSLGHHLALLQGLHGGFVVILMPFSVDHLLLPLLVPLVDRFVLDCWRRVLVYRCRLLVTATTGREGFIFLSGTRVQDLVECGRCGVHGEFSGLRGVGDG